MNKNEALGNILESLKLEEQKGITYINGDTDEVFISYKSLYEKAACVLYGLEDIGIKKGQELILLLDSNEQFINVFWACIMGGIIPVPVSIGVNDEQKRKLSKIWNILASPNLVTSEDVFNRYKKYFEENDMNNLNVEISSKTIFYKDLDNIIYKSQVKAVNKDDIAFIQFSSGSTGEPKGVVLTHENLLTDIDGIIDSTALTAEDTWLSWLPLTHDMGIIALHLTPVRMKTNHFIMPTPLFIRRPTLWLKKASEHKVTLIASPNFGYNYFLNSFSPEGAVGWDLSSIRLAFNGAEPISYSICREFTKKMSQYNLNEDVIFPSYGMAEACVAVAFPPINKKLIVYRLSQKSISLGQTIVDAEDGEEAFEYVDVGCPVKYCSIRICDETNKALGEKVIGEVQIKGKNVTHGYYNNKKANDNTFTGDGWLKTGDSGFIRDGRLTITGRIKDIIFVNGQNFYSNDIERVAEQLGLVNPGEVVACGAFDKELKKEVILIFVYFKKRLEDFVPLAISLKNQLSKRIGLDIYAIIPVRKIPKTTSGKVERYSLSERYLNCEFETIISDLNSLICKELKQRIIDMPLTEVERIISSIICETLKTESIDINDNIFELGTDSLNLQIMYQKFEEQFPGILALPQIFVNPSISQLSQLILSDNSAHMGLENEETDFDKEMDELFEKIEKGVLSIEEASEHI
jgi:acyl-CoA synthetase (AMP-forming)/AMP-acid ligase II